MKTKSMIAIIVALSFILAGCAASFTKDAYRGLSVSHNAYDSTMSAMSDLYKDGLLGQAQKDEIIKYANLYVVAHNESVAMLAQYETTNNDEDKESYLLSVAIMSARLAYLLEMARPYLEGGN